MKHLTTYAKVAGIALFANVSSGLAVEKVNGNYQWSFLSGQPWPAGYNQNIGKPNNLIYARNEYSAEFFQRINNALPERKINEAFLTDDSGSNITLKEDAEVFVTFIHEGAGYKNSFGFFTFDANNPPQSIYDVRETIVFPNLSYPHLTNGHRLSLGEFEAGTSIGFFLVANGFWWDTGVKPFAAPYYYSLSGLNPERHEHHKQHMVALYDEEVKEVILGFEDLPRSWGDNDFNDAVFSVKSTPHTAIQSDTLPQMPEVNDSDADGIPDEEDAYPNDYRRAYSSFYPSANGYVTLAFEDNWPHVGDYDLNDLVVRERLETIYSANGGISGVKVSGYIDARGAANHNGLGLRILYSENDLIDSASITIDGNVFDKAQEPYQSNATILLWRDTQVFTTTGGSGQCSHFNTVQHCESFQPVPFELDVRFSVDLNNLKHSDLDFFMFRRDNRGHEIHFADYPPTDLADATMFGKHADTSDASQQRYYRNEANLPWALKLSGSWSYPREYIDVVWAYPSYQEWVQSSGQSKQDWYTYTERTTHIYLNEE